ncbi:hypothetical protein P171DRAFT_437173 [Karstenula rhodostoma CBS 690.94]|uniref:Uncharacterized protein n=1 Tax=Karstenula rhodostoma CBS 690.94 TaxID=1392251 RepID=A0A9P4P600_9PLEO|nr:hypothetical protein P171DRAFT_437173 [Karstenula rhodostoma CBS 690.94]
MHERARGPESAFYRRRRGFASMCRRNILKTPATENRRGNDLRNRVRKGDVSVTEGAGLAAEGHYYNTNNNINRGSDPLHYCEPEMCTVSQVRPALFSMMSEAAVAGVEKLALQFPTTAGVSYLQHPEQAREQYRGHSISACMSKSIAPVVKSLARSVEAGIFDVRSVKLGLQAYFSLPRASGRNPSMLLLASCKGGHLARMYLQRPLLRQRKAVVK